MLKQRLSVERFIDLEENTNSGCQKHLLDIYWSCQVYLTGPPQILSEEPVTLMFKICIIIVCRGGL